VGDVRCPAKYAFSSYSREDSTAVDVVQAALELAGVHVWRDVDQLWPGDDWKSVIRGRSLVMRWHSWRAFPAPAWPARGLGSLRSWFWQPASCSSADQVYPG
jgi:hypothetical protein